MLKKGIVLITCCLGFLAARGAGAEDTAPVRELLERIDAGASGKFILEITDRRSAEDFFELDQKGNKVVIRGNSNLSLAAGVNWYLKHYAGIHLSWNGMQALLPKKLPPVGKPERRSTSLLRRYYLDFPVYTYETAFWDWPRWRREIDWMALHGVTMPLAAAGTESVWARVLGRLGYSEAEIARFIPAPPYLGLWNEGKVTQWEGETAAAWYERATALQKKIVGAMRAYGMEPILPAFNGSMPRDAAEKLNIATLPAERWNGFPPPVYIAPDDPRFREIAQLYYQEMNRLYGEADYYASPDIPAEMGEAVFRALKNARPGARWIVPLANERMDFLGPIDRGDVILLDKSAQAPEQKNAPAVNDPYSYHDWILGITSTRGGNTGLYGSIGKTAEAFRSARNGARALSLSGIGLAGESIGNNAVIAELIYELPWTDDTDPDQWLEAYVTARYGGYNANMQRAWKLLAEGVYGPTEKEWREGAFQSPFAARPSLRPERVSKGGTLACYYDADTLTEVVRIFAKEAAVLGSGNNFQYDFVDIVRQAAATKGLRLLEKIRDAYEAKNRQEFSLWTTRFLDLLERQDELLGTRKEFLLGTRLLEAKNAGAIASQKALYEEQARRLYSTFGNRYTANGASMHDYGYREWNGLLKDLYYARWKRYFSMLDNMLAGKESGDIDFYAQEEEWCMQNTVYTASPKGAPVSVGIDLIKELLQD